MLIFVTTSAEMNTAKCLMRERQWICHTCHTHLKKGAMPSLAVANKLELTDIPPEQCDLNILERHLIAKCIKFAKMIPLPKGRQQCIRGNVILFLKDDSSVSEVMLSAFHLRLRKLLMPCQD